MVLFLFTTKISRHWRLRCTYSKKRKKKKDLASEIISNIFCLQKQYQHDLRQQTDFNETDHNSERYRT